MPRINKAIALLERGDILTYTSLHDLSYERGVEMASTWADFLLADFEHQPFDVAGLAAFMQGLVDGGPTPDGFRTPAVLATLPSNCRTPEEVHHNAWQIRQVLTAGVHGVLHTHARQPAAVRAFVEHCRYPMAREGVDSRSALGEGQRGAGGQARPAAIWGVTPQEYVRLADPWPLNPQGELLLGLKLEDRECVANAAFSAQVPGIAFAEWGPGDMGMSYGYDDAHDPPYPPELEAARHAIKQACDDNGLFFLSSWNDPDQTPEENARFLLDWGVRIVSGHEEIARAAKRLSRG
jgi:4-hydroxy-2-oxoheptanedioate aldolase